MVQALTAACLKTEHWPHQNQSKLLTKSLSFLMIISTKLSNRSDSWPSHLSLSVLARVESLKTLWNISIRKLLIFIPRFPGCWELVECQNCPQPMPRPIPCSHPKTCQTGMRRRETAASPGFARRRIEPYACWVPFSST